MKLTFPSTLYTSHSSAAQPLRHRKNSSRQQRQAPSGHTRPRRSPAPVPPGRCPNPFGPCPASGGSYPADDPSTSGYPTSGRCARPFSWGAERHGAFSAQNHLRGRACPSGWAATPNTARYSAQRQKPCISPSAPFLRSPPSCGVSNYCYFNRHSDENQADGPIVSCIFTE